MDLRSPEAFWLIRNGLLIDRKSLAGDSRCEVLVIGAGITGALVAERLTREGLDVIVVDRRRTAAGSTAASTALLIYDIDRPLYELVEVVGESTAVRAYRMGIEAIRELQELSKNWPDVDFVRRRSLLVAQPHQADIVEKEYEARHQHGFEVTYLDENTLLGEYGIHRPNAMRAEVAAEVDPYRLTHRLLAKAASRGARIYDRVRVADKTVEGDRVVVSLEGGGRIEAERVVYATGYEAAQVVGHQFVKLHSTFALASEPYSSFGYWSDRALIWETGDPYLYLRATSRGRIIVGGEDVPFQNAAARDRILAKKVDAILAKLKEMMPDLPVRCEFAWAGTFGHTHDGLPYIGAHSDHPGCLFALGYGGNGITFSTMAAWILADMCLGKDHPDAHMFAFNRPTAGGG